MNIKDLQKAINESRNGANLFVRHPLCRNVLYSDGVQDGPSPYKIILISEY